MLNTEGIIILCVFIYLLNNVAGYSLCAGRGKEEKTLH